VRAGGARRLYAVPAAGGAGELLYVGPGWDGALMGLGRFLRGEDIGDPVAATNSPEAREFSTHSVHAWAAAVKDSGTPPEQLVAATEVSLAQFAPDHATPPDQQPDS
jgi:hypothetical protein